MVTCSSIGYAFLTSRAQSEGGLAKSPLPYHWATLSLSRSPCMPPVFNPLTETDCSNNTSVTPSRRTTPKRSNAWSAGTNHHWKKSPCLHPQMFPAPTLRLIDLRCSYPRETGQDPHQVVLPVRRFLVLRCSYRRLRRKTVFHRCHGIIFVD